MTHVTDQAWKLILYGVYLKKNRQLTKNGAYKHRNIEIQV